MIRVFAASARPAALTPPPSFTATVAVTFALAALGACSEPAPEAPAESPPPPPSAAAATAKPVRLFEVLKRANVIESPLLQIATASPADDILRGVATETVFAEDFESFRLEDARFTGNAVRVGRRPPDTAERLGSGSGNDKALRYGGGRAATYAFVLPADASTRYRIRRGIRTSNPSVDVNVLETRVPLRHPGVLNHPDDVRAVFGGNRFVSVRSLLYVHRFADPRARDTWQLDDLHIFTTRATRSLVLIIDDAESTVAGSDLEVWLDDLRVDALLPTREQELALLAAGPASESIAIDGVPRGMVRHGQLLPVGSTHNLPPELEHNFDYRYGIIAPTPTVLRFEIDVAPRARLRFSAALAESSHTGDLVDFSVTAAPIDGGAAEVTTLYRRRLQLDAEANDHQWHDAQVDLAAFGGRRIALTLRATAPEGASGVGVWGSPIIDVPRAAGDPPNIVVIAVDTLRADRLSCYGNPHPTSPRIDALASEGVRFDQAVSQSNWTTCAFASIFTGLWPSRHQVIHRTRSIAPSLTTLTERFHDAGWLTQGIAYKAYLYNMGFEQGFDRWFNVPRSDNTGVDNLREALAFLDESADRRFFLFFHLNDPHQPFKQPPPFDRKFNTAADLNRFGASIPLTVGLDNGVLGCKRCTKNGKLDPAFKEVASDLYDGAVAFTDDLIGRFLDALHERGVYDDTIIAIVADHGESIWDHDDYFGHGGPTMYDELIRVPLIIKPHRRAAIEPGRVVSTQVRTFDLMPTLLELAGVETGAGEGEDSTSLLPHLRGESSGGHLIAMSENIKQHVLSVRDGRWKYILRNRPDRRAEERLFDLETDPRERHDLASAAEGEAADALSRLRRETMEHWIQNRSGRYVLVLGDGAGRAGEAIGAPTYDVTVTTGPGLQDARSLFGIPAAPKNSALRFVGASRGPVALLAHLDLPDASLVDVTVRRGDVTVTGAALPYREGLLHELVVQLRKDRGKDLGNDVQRGAGVRAYVIQGPPPKTTFAANQSLNGDQLATLRALGYIQ